MIDWYRTALLATFFLTAQLLQAQDCSGNGDGIGSEITAEEICSGCAAAPGAPPFVRPVDLQSSPGDTERLFVVERGGTIQIVDLATDTITGTFLNITDRVFTSTNFNDERGLLGLAFHPDYENGTGENDFIFVNYIANDTTDGRVTRISRFSLTSMSDANEADEEVLLQIKQPAGNHNAGAISFGPMDGYLYIPMGDGGRRCDRAANAGQDGDQLLAKILRIDVDNLDLDATPKYSIPGNNPFVTNPDVEDEIWAFGLRNPFRSSFDSATGDFYIADVGQNRREEVNVQPASSTGGENYEWANREGFDAASLSPSNCESAPVGEGVQTPPQFDYPHSGAEIAGCSVTGGYVYRGSAIPALQGAYFFADFCENFIATMRYDPTNATFDTPVNRTADLNAGVQGSITSISSFGTDGSAEMYIASLGGRVYRIVPQITTPLPFDRGNANGDTSYDISDPVAILIELFGTSDAAIDCSDALDSNDDGSVNIADALHSLNVLFASGQLPPAPFEECGCDPTPDELGCNESNCPS